MKYGLDQKCQLLQPLYMFSLMFNLPIRVRNCIYFFAYPLRPFHVLLWVREMVSGCREELRDNKHLRVKKIESFWSRVNELFPHFDLNSSQRQIVVSKKEVITGQFNAYLFALQDGILLFSRSINALVTVNWRINWQ